MWNATPVRDVIKITDIFTLLQPCRDADYSSSVESHDFWECLYVVRGSVRATGGEKTYILSPGDIIFHKPLEVHKVDVNGGRDATILVFTFNMHGSICSFFERKVFSLGLAQTEQINGISKIVDTYFIPELYENWPASLGDEKIQMLSEYIKLLLLSLYNEHTELSESNKKEARLFKEIVLYFKENIDKSISIKDIAEAFFTSETNVKKIFRDYCGIGAHSYFLKMKTSRAAELLREGKSVNEVSESLGFCDSAYMSTVFKRLMGVTPSAYRKMHLK